MAVIGLRIHLRLFLEGVEVPIVSAHVQAQKNAPAVCSIQLPANDYAMDLRPRTRVWVFNYDPYHGAPPESQVSVGGPGVRVETVGVDPDASGFYPPERLASTADQTLTDLENENYKHMFSGEMIGITYMKTPTSRCVVLQCVDWSNYWDIAYQYQVGGFSLGGGGIRAAFTGASTTVFNDFLEGSGDIITKLMETAPRSYPSLKGTLLGGITHIIEAIGGVYYGKNAIRGVNDFFSLAEMSLHITQMLGVNPYEQGDEVRLLHANGFGSLFSRALSGLGKMVTIRQVLLALQKYIFHEIIPITSPRFIPALRDPNLPSTEMLGLDEDKATKPLAKTAEALRTRAEEIIERQEASSDVESAELASNRRGGLLQELRALQRLADSAAKKSATISISTGNRLDSTFRGADVSAAFLAASGEFRKIEQDTAPLNRPGVRKHRFHWGDANGPINRVILHCSSVINLMTVVLESRHEKRILRATQQPDPPPRLMMQIYRPDVWMVSPPRCNVWFPELYSSFNYGRQFQSEVTRLLLRTHSAFYGSDQIFDGYYIAPGNPRGVRTGKTIGQGRAKLGTTTARDTTGPANIDAPAWVIKDLMEHELYTGIIPSFERMSDLNLHAIRGGVVSINDVKVDYAQLAANHIFFQYRFRSRDLSLSGKFNPFAVLGFPSLVIDKYMPVDALRTADYDSKLAQRLANAVSDGENPAFGLPEPERQYIVEINKSRANEILRSATSQRPNTHFLGTPAMISHNVDATRGGTTTVQMEYARTTNERAEFLGDNVGIPSRARRTRDQNVNTTVAAIQPPGIGTSGPRGGKVTAVVDVTDQYAPGPRGRPAVAAAAGTVEPPVVISSDVKRQVDGIVQQTREVTVTFEEYAATQAAYEAARAAASAATRRAELAARHGKRLPFFVPDHKTQGRARRGTTVVVGVDQPVEEYGPEIVAWAGTTGDTTQSISVRFNAYRVTETIGIYVRSSVELAPEDYTFPPWYGEHYRSNKIGGLYAYFFGIGSITDPLTVVEPSTTPRGTPRMPSSNTLVLTRSEPETALQAVDQAPEPGLSTTVDASGADFTGPSGGELTQEDILEDSVMGQVDFRSPISEAVEEIVDIYSKVKVQGFDVHEFLKAYTWRPIATMVDILGTANLQIADDGEVTQGVEGFHSRAFGDFDDLRQLIGPTDGTRPRTIMGQTTVETAEGFEKATDISARFDTRKEKRIAVLSYLYSVLASRGILG